jgi:hypothetical protein
VLAERATDEVARGVAPECVEHGEHDPFAALRVLEQERDRPEQAAQVERAGESPAAAQSGRLDGCRLGERHQEPARGDRNPHGHGPAGGQDAARLREHEQRRGEAPEPEHPVLGRHHGEQLERTERAHQRGEPWKQPGRPREQRVEDERDRDRGGQQPQR